MRVPSCVHRVHFRVCLNLHLSPYPSISMSRSSRNVCRGHPVLLMADNLMQDWGKSSASPAVTRYSVFFWLLIFHTSPLIVSWRSLSLYLVKVWLCFPSLTAQICYVKCSLAPYNIPMYVKYEFIFLRIAFPFYSSLLWLVFG